MTAFSVPSTAAPRPYPAGHQQRRQHRACPQGEQRAADGRDDQDVQRPTDVAEDAAGFGVPSPGPMGVEPVGDESVRG